MVLMSPPVGDFWAQPPSTQFSRSSEYFSLHGILASTLKSSCIAGTI